jgi:hypothetical protein
MRRIDSKGPIDSLVSMYTPASHTGQMSLKSILTSRPYGRIERPFRKLPSIRLKAEEQTPAISADIELAINSEVVEALGNAWYLTYGDRTNIRDKLIQGADRTFLWVSLLFKISAVVGRPPERHPLIPSTAYQVTWILSTKIFSEIVASPRRPNGFFK